MVKATGFIVGVVGAVAVAGSAWGQSMTVPPGRWWDRPRVATALGLTDDQRATLDAVALEHAKAMIDLKADVEKAEIDLRAAADREPFDPKPVRAAFNVLLQKRTTLEQERFELLVRVRQVLSADQWRKLTAFVKERLGNEKLNGGDGSGQAPQRRLQRQRPF